MLVAVSTGEDEETEHSLKELAELAETAGVEVVASIYQRRENPEPGTYIGSGKIEEIRELIDRYEADGVITDDELSPAQLNNLTDLLDCKVLDRTMLILDIFASRARSSEGKLQVEMAQLSYRLQRLKGLGKSLSRLGGGIGTRGPGEKKLETDRRLIQKRIAVLRRELAQVKKHRDVIYQNRRTSGIPVAALIGYTNAGKSTLLNTLTGENIYADDRLFATLDPTTRLLTFPDGGRILLTDTVGFIRKLPHHLIEAFSGTLEEVREADILIQVLDASDSQYKDHAQVVYETLKNLGVQGKTMLTLYNKMDRLKGDQSDVKFYDKKAERSLKISARTGEGLEALRDTLEQLLLARHHRINLLLPYEQGGYLARIRKEGQLLSETYEEQGIRILAMVPSALFGKLESFQVE